MEEKAFLTKPFLDQLALAGEKEAFLKAVAVHDPKGAYFLMRKAGISSPVMLEVIKKMQATLVE